MMIIWSNLKDVNDVYDDILDSYSNNVYVNTKGTNDFWGPVTIVCDGDDWDVIIANDTFYNDTSVINATHLTSKDDETSDDKSKDDSSDNNDRNEIYTSCNEYVKANFDKLETDEEYWSLYWLVGDEEEENGGKIKDFKNYREFAYILAIVCSAIIFLVACCLGCGSVGMLLFVYLFYLFVARFVICNL